MNVEFIPVIDGVKNFAVVNSGEVVILVKSGRRRFVFNADYWSFQLF